MLKSSILMMGTLLLSQVGAVDIGYRYLGKINSPQAAFVTVGRFNNDPEFLLISNFGPTSSGKVSLIPNIADVVKNNGYANAKTTVIDSSFTWPNSVLPIPEAVFGQGTNAFIVPDGFLVPFHTKGGVYVLTVDPKDPTKKTGLTKLTTDKSGYFYHTGNWVDLNGDGRLDFITARSNAKAGQGELLWLEHPEGGLNTSPWTEHVIDQGPDVWIETVELAQYPNSYIVFSAEFFEHKVSIRQVSKTNGQLIAKRVIDDQIDQAYSSRYIDLNGDGSPVLLLNNHETDSSKAGVYTYSLPHDLFNGEIVKTTIASGFSNAWSLFVPNMCPGFPYPVHPQTKTDASTPYHILIAGDGDYSAHLMRPQGAGKWNRETIKNLGGTVGSLATADVDGDGWLEFFVPNYDQGYIEVYSFYDKVAHPEYNIPISTEDDDEDWIDDIINDIDDIFSD